MSESKRVEEAGGNMVKAICWPALWAMNRMTYAVKFVFIGVALLLPFAYVTHIMLKGANQQIVFNQKESDGVDYIAPGARFLARLQACRTFSAALLAGDASSRAELARETREADALIPGIDAVDARCREGFRTVDGRDLCGERWTEIKRAWVALRERTFASPRESFDAYTGVCALVTDWILNYAANYSNLILDPDLDSYWLMDAYVATLPRIAEGMSQACALSLGFLSDSRPLSADERFAIHERYVQAASAFREFRDVNLKTAYAFNRARSGDLEPRLEPLVRTWAALVEEYLSDVRRRLLKPATPEIGSRDLTTLSRRAVEASHALYEAVGPELKALIDARVAGYSRDKTAGLFAAHGATFLHVYLFVAFYLAIHASVAKIARFTQRMLEGTREHFVLDSRDELGKVAESYNRINAALVETRELKGELERRTGELRQSEGRFRTLANRAPVGILLTDPDGRCEFVNERWCGLASLAPEEAAGQGWLRAVHPDDRDRVDREWSAAIRAGKDFASEYRFGSPDRPVWLAARAVPLRDAEGRLAGFLGSITDISEQKRVEKLKNEFISTVSHELRTPLTSIRGSLGLLSGGVAGALTPKAKSMIDIAKKNCERLVRLVSDILDIEKIESGKMTFDIRPLDLKSAVDQAVEAGRGYAQSLGVSIRIEDDGPGVRVLADPDRLAQVLTNLLSNASKFSPRGGTVRVRTEIRDEAVRVSVRDEGPGVPEEFRARIFGKFAQADGSDGRAKQGTGLGLSISKAIVERMAGRIGFESASGRGSTFFFDLPLPERPARAATARRPDRPSVLVCEDEGDIATVLRGILEEAGYNVDVAGTAAQAKDLLRENGYAGMTLDLALPDQDGISLVRELREDARTRSLPIVVVSAYMEEGRRSLSGEAFGILDWLEKPIDEARLKTALARAVELLPGREPRILHVEDDRDIHEVVRASLADRATTVLEDTLAGARARLLRERFDLLILDIGLPDGSGLELLPALRGTPNAATPVVLFSAQVVSPGIARHVQAVLLKSTTSNEELAETLGAILPKSASPGGGTPVRSLNVEVNV